MNGDSSLLHTALRSVADMWSIIHPMEYIKDKLILDHSEGVTKQSEMRS